MHTVTAAGIELTVVQLHDRRQSLAAPIQQWCFQSELENYLYANWQTKGSFFKLLSRAGADGLSLCLRRKAVEEGLVTDAEFIAMRNVVGPAARAYTLVPAEAIKRALMTYGKTPRAEALATALHLDPFREPDDDDEEEEEEEEEDDDDAEEEEEEEEEEEQDEGGDVDDSDDDEEKEGQGQDKEDADEESGSGGAEAAGGSGAGPSSGGAGDIYPDTEEEGDGEPPNVEGDATSGKAPRRPVYALSEIPAKLEAELASLEQWRVSPINVNRKGVAVMETTSEYQRKNVVRFLGWLVAENKLSIPTLNAFGSVQIGAAVQMYVRHLVSDQGRKYSSVAVYVSSFVAAARFVHSRRSAVSSGGQADIKPVDDLKALHAQLLQQARQQATYDLAKPDKKTLEWSDVQRTRCRVEEALATLNETAPPSKRRLLVRDLALMNFLTHQPPDRVGVARLLQIGGTLKREGGGFQLDLSQPGDHKTIAAFGPSLTTVPAVIAKSLQAHISFSAVPESGYVFSKVGDPFEPLPSDQWTRLVQAMFKRYSGVSLAPKDLRSSHVTWLKTGEHDDATLRAAAQAMRHSSKTQDSAAYNKGKSDRLVQQAVDAAAAFASQFTAGEA